MANDLIKIDHNERGEQVVSARELHRFLEVTTRFDIWIERMIDYGFEANKDYLEVTIKNDHNSKGGRSTLIDYALTMDTAKEIAMLQRTEKGKEARRYFIECEKQLKAYLDSLSPSERLLRACQIAVENEKRLAQVEKQQQKLEQVVEEVAARQTDIDRNFYSLGGYYRLRKRNFDLTKVQAQQVGKTLASKSRQLGYTISSTYSDKYGEVNTYHTNILQAVLGF